MQHEEGDGGRISLWMDGWMRGMWRWNDGKAMWRGWRRKQVIDGRWRRRKRVVIGEETGGSVYGVSGGGVECTVEHHGESSR